MSLDTTISDAEIVQVGESIDDIRRKEAESPSVTNTISEAQMAMKSYEAHAGMFIDKLTNSQGSKRQLINMMINSTISPLNKEPLQFSYQEEKDLFDLFNEANSAKMVLMLHGLEDAGIIKILKPLMEVQFTESEKELATMQAGLETKTGE